LGWLLAFYSIYLEERRHALKERIRRFKSKD